MSEMSAETQPEKRADNIMMERRFIPADAIPEPMALPHSNSILDFYPSKRSSLVRANLVGTQILLTSYEYFPIYVGAKGDEVEVRELAFRMTDLVPNARLALDVEAAEILYDELGRQLKSLKESVKLLHKRFEAEDQGE